WWRYVRPASPSRGLLSVPVVCTRRDAICYTFAVTTSAAYWLWHCRVMMPGCCRSVPFWPVRWPFTGRPDTCWRLTMTIDKQLPSTRTTELDSICHKAEVIPVLTIERLEDAVP